MSWSGGVYVRTWLYPKERTMMTTEGDPSPGEAAQTYVYKTLAASAIALLAVGTVMYRLLEDWSWVDALYFSTVAITTVGFGDLTPSTDGSKLFTIVYIVSGISIFMTYLNVRMQRRTDRHGKNSRRSNPPAHEPPRP
jgi:hypothetical protein